MLLKFILRFQPQDLKSQLQPIGFILTADYTYSKVQFQQRVCFVLAIK